TPPAPDERRSQLKPADRVATADARAAAIAAACAGAPAAGERERAGPADVTARGRGAALQRAQSPLRPRGARATGNHSSNSSGVAIPPVAGQSSAQPASPR